MKLKQPTKKMIREAYVAAANDIHGRDGECEVEDNAKVSMGSDPGAYVQAWVWVYDSAMHKKLKELHPEVEVPAGDLAHLSRRRRRRRRKALLTMNTPQWKCTLCGRVGSVGRCCGLDTREPLNDAAREEHSREKSEDGEGDA